MGFGVPGALGAQLGSGVRPLVLAGDGAFQMTGPEIAHAPRYGIDPIVVVVNNGGWQIFRPGGRRTALLDLPCWPDAALARAWGGGGLGGGGGGGGGRGGSGGGGEKVLRGDRGVCGAGRPLAGIAQVHRGVRPPWTLGAGMIVPGRRYEELVATFTWQVPEE